MMDQVKIELKRWFMALLISSFLWLAAILPQKPFYCPTVIIGSLYTALVLCSLSICINVLVCP